MRNQIVIGDEKKGVDCRRLIGLTGGPRANRTECREQAIVRFHKKVIPAIFSPIGKRITASQKFVADSLNAEYVLCRVVLDQPIPEGGIKVDAVVKVLRLNKNVCVKQIR